MTQNYPKETAIFLHNRTRIPLDSLHFLETFLLFITSRQPTLPLLKVCNCKLTLGGMFGAVLGVGCVGLMCDQIKKQNPTSHQKHKIMGVCSADYGWGQSGPETVIYKSNCQAMDNNTISIKATKTVQYSIVQCSVQNSAVQYSTVLTMDNNTVSIKTTKTVQIFSSQLSFLAGQYLVLLVRSCPPTIPSHRHRKGPENSRLISGNHCQSNWS